MERLKYLLLGFIALTLTGCGQSVVQTLNIPEDPGPNAPGKGKTAVILPFADYSHGNDVTSAFRRNMMVTETLTDRLISVGFSTPIQEDVFQYLVAENVIDLMPYDTINAVSLQHELVEGGWSTRMKAEIQRYVNQQNVVLEGGATGNPGTHGLTKNTVAKIGRYFGADYIVRGRILEFKTRQDTEWAPWKKGILPFINNGANRILFGFASSDQYDELNHSLTGGILGARIGYESAHWPWGDGDEILGISGGNDANAILWGAVGLGAGKQLHKSGRVDQAAVQLRIWVQEASSGEVVWTNRISVKVSPESFLADNQYDTLFNQAIEKGVSTLIDNFVIYSLM